MARKPGEIMGYVAFGHPFLDGNGRTILTTHVVLCDRASISVEAALTLESNHPGDGYLDEYLRPLIGSGLGRPRFASHIARTPAIGANPEAPPGAVEALGTFSEPAVQERYRREK
jgi:cell filamentation protein